jgi:hypothetical protein
MDAPRAGLDPAHAEQGEQGDDAALAAVVGAQDEDAVLDRDHHDQRPQDERQHAQQRVRGKHAAAPGGTRGFLQGIKGTGPDIAEHDPESTEDERSGRAFRTRTMGSGVDRGSHGGPGLGTVLAPERENNLGGTAEFRPRAGGTRRRSCITSRAGPCSRPSRMRSSGTRASRTGRANSCRLPCWWCWASSCGSADPRSRSPWRPRMPRPGTDRAGRRPSSTV